MLPCINCGGKQVTIPVGFVVRSGLMDRRSHHWQEIAARHVHARGGLLWRVHRLLLIVPDGRNQRRGWTERATALVAKLRLAVAADQVVRRASGRAWVPSCSL